MMIEPYHPKNRLQVNHHTITSESYASSEWCDHSDIPSDTTHSITLSLQMNDTISRIIRLQVNRMIHLNRTISNLKTLRFDSKLRFESYDSIFDSKLCNSTRTWIFHWWKSASYHMETKKHFFFVFWYPHYDDTCWGENKCRVKIQSVSHGKK